MGHHGPTCLVDTDHRSTACADHAESCGLPFGGLAGNPENHWLWGKQCPPTPTQGAASRRQMTDDAELRKPPHPPPFSGNSVAALGQQQTAGNARPGPLCSAEVGLLLPVLQAFQVLTAPSLQVFTQTRAPQRGIRNPCHTPAHMPWESLSSWAGNLHEAGLWVPWPPEQRSA